VVAEHPVGPAAGREGGQVAVDVAGDPPGLPGGGEQLEVERDLDPGAVGAVVGDGLLQRQHQLGQQHPVVAELVDHLADLGGQLAGLGPVDVPDRQLAHEGEVLARPVVRVGRVVAELIVLDQQRQHVDAEPVDPSGQPEPQGVEHGRLHLRVAPVEVGLGVEEHPVVVLAGALVPAPGALAVVVEPVAGRAAAGPGVAPDVPVTLGGVPARAGGQEPGMLVGGVVRHPVEQHPQPPPVGGRDQPVQVVEGAEQRVDVAVVGHVVAEVGHG
jgi:hypothetical protein